MKRAIAALLALAACAPDPLPATPALWQVTGPAGETAWLFGTIHALEQPVAWRGTKVDEALAASGVLVTELSPGDDGTAIARHLAALDDTASLPPLEARIPAGLRPALARLIARSGASAAGLAAKETWAAALALAQASAPADGTANGIDRAVMAAWQGKPVEALEGAGPQLALFDALPEAEQRDLLAAVIRESTAKPDPRRLGEAWRKGDMATIAQATREGLLADPELRAALYTARNRQWTARIAMLVAEGRRPFVAVGAAHLAGADSLPALLTAQGFRVSRVQ